MTYYGRLKIGLLKSVLEARVKRSFEDYVMALAKTASNRIERVEADSPRADDSSAKKVLAFMNRSHEVAITIAGHISDIWYKVIDSKMDFSGGVNRYARILIESGAMKLIGAHKLRIQEAIGRVPKPDAREALLECYGIYCEGLEMITSLSGSLVTFNSRRERVRGDYVRAEAKAASKASD